MGSLLAIANSGAGTSSDDAVEDALAVLREAHDVELVETGSPDELEDALSAHPDVDGVVVLGGDGSLHAVVQALHDADRLGSVTVGLVPLGTGNDFAATLELPDEPADAARTIVAGRPRTLDLAVDDAGDVTVNAAHVGIGAEAAAAAKPWKERLGPVGYPIGALISWFRTPGARLDVRVDGRRLPRHHVIHVAVGNGRFVGGGAALLPDADPGDGLLDVSVSYAVSVRRRLVYAWALVRAKHPQLQDVQYLRGSEVSVQGDALRCTNDGELGDPRESYAWRVLPGALRMWA